MVPVASMVKKSGSGTLGRKTLGRETLGRRTSCKHGKEKQIEDIYERSLGEGILSS